MSTLHFMDINFYAIFFAWIIHNATGLLWFQTKLFGNELIIEHKIPKQKKC